ncbi:MAG: hypothetical protein KDK26_01895 [Roseivivax sp.]|nr:hypothetical protein [Roseivivax sp.]
MVRTVCAVVLSLSVCATAPQAQTDVCRDANGNIDQTATQGLQAFRANASAEAMQPLIGTWYTEIPSPQTGQIAYRYQTLEPSGLFTMQTRVCDNLGLCSDYAGHGAWAAQAAAGPGMVTVMSTFSDTQVTNYCWVGQVQVSADMMQTSAGQSWRRVR